MMNIHISRLPASEADVRAALVDYRAALEAHKLTEGVPAPWPAFEVLRDIVAAGDQFAVVVDDEPAPPDPLALKRASALWALQEEQLAQAMTRPDAPQAVKDYAAEQQLQAAKSDPLKAVK
jgi:hypothetical protein